MKKQITGSLVILFALLLFGSGCQFAPKKNNWDAKYKKAQQLENTANFYFHEAEPDSALKSFRKSLALYTQLADSIPPEKDTLFRYKMAYINSCISSVFDTLHNLDSALAYEIKSLHFVSNKGSETENREILNYDIALYYKKLGDKKGNKTDSGKALYRKGILYAQSACWEKDSLGEHSENTLWAYHLAMNMYTVTGDTVRGKFYQTKYTELNNALHPPTMQNAPAQPSVQKQTVQKTNTTPDKTTKDNEEDRFLKAFRKGFERGLKKYGNNSNYNSNSSNNSDYNSNSNVTVNKTVNSDGSTTTVTTTIANGVETITTEVNGVVVKKETKKLD